MKNADQLASATGLARVGLSAFAITAAATWSHLAYVYYVVPRLPELHSVPNTWWAVLFAPVVVAALASGWHLKSAMDYVATVLVSAASIEALRAVAVALGHPSLLGQHSRVLR